MQKQKELVNNLDKTEEKLLRECVQTSIDTFFEHMDGHPVTNLYELVMFEVEGPLLSSVMKHTKDNQSRASELLGINRGTLRKKLKQHNLL